MRIWPHLKFDFLQPEKIRDIQRRSPKDPDYNSKTVFVPHDFLLNQTPVSVYYHSNATWILTVTINFLGIYSGNETVVGTEEQTFRLYTLLQSRQIL